MFSFLTLNSGALAAEVLIVGDSHNVGSFGEALYQELKNEMDMEVRSVGLAGASGTTYSSNVEKQRTLRAGYANRSKKEQKVIPHGAAVTVPTLSDLIKEEQPQIVVIELGDNFAGYSSAVTDVYVKNQVQSVLKQFDMKSPAPKCFWITPIWTDKEGIGPYKKTNERLYQVNKLIKEAAGSRCTVLDSTKDLGLKKEEINVLNDGIHFGPVSGKRWGKAAARTISQKLRAAPGKAPSQSGVQ